MTLNERRARVTLVVVALTAAVYATCFGVAASRMPVDEIPYQAGLLLTTLGLLALVVVGRLGARRATDPGDRGADERDREVWWRATTVAYRVVVCLLNIPLFLALQGASTVWIAHAVYATFLGALLAQCAAATVLYRRG